MWGVGWLQLYEICSQRMVHREVGQTWSNCFAWEMHSLFFNWKLVLKIMWKKLFFYASFSSTLSCIKGNLIYKNMCSNWLSFLKTNWQQWCGKKLLKIFLWYQQSPEIKEKLIKQINTLKLFNMEPRKAILRRNISYWKKITARKKSI